MTGYTERRDAAHVAHVDQVNARLAHEGRCIMHNPDVSIPARYLLEVPIGNILPLCTECCEWWQADAKESGDPWAQPVHIRRLTNSGGT